MDTLVAVGGSDQEWRWLEKTAWPFVTSFFVFFVTCFTFIVCMARISLGLKSAVERVESLGVANSRSVGRLMKKWRTSALSMCGVIGFLSVNFLLLGSFTGFSILLIISVMMTIASCLRWTGGAAIKLQST